MQRQMELWPMKPHRPCGGQNWIHLNHQHQHDVITTLAKLITKCVQEKASHKTQEDCSE